jgi:hypothetical protein
VVVIQREVERGVLIHYSVADHHVEDLLHIGLDEHILFIRFNGLTDLVFAKFLKDVACATLELLKDLIAGVICHEHNLLIALFACAIDNVVLHDKDRQPHVLCHSGQANLVEA